MAEHVNWKKLLNKRFLGHWDFEDGKDMIVRIKDVRIETIQSKTGREDKPVMYFENGVKPMVLNSTNMESIAKALGAEFVDEWIGKKIQLYVTMVFSYGENVKAIRVREEAPRG